MMPTQFTVMFLLVGISLRVKSFVRLIVLSKLRFISGVSHFIRIYFVTLIAVVVGKSRQAFGHR